MLALPVPTTPDQEARGRKVEGKLVALVRTRVELLACLSRVKDAAGMSQPSADALKLFAGQLSSIASLSDGCAVELMSMFQAAALTAEDKAKAIEFVNEKLQDGTHDESPTDQGKQENHYFEQYLQVDDVDANIVAHPQTTMAVRFQALARVSRKLGMNHLTEAGKARVMAPAFHDSPPEFKYTINSASGNQLFRQFKKLWDKSPMLVGGRDPPQFPPFEQFEAEHPLLYAAAGFAPGTIKPTFDKATQMNINELFGHIPLRSSSMSVRTDAIARPATPARAALEDGRSRAARMSNSVERSLSHSGLESLPGFRWCGFGEPPTSAPTLGQAMGFPPLPSPPQLALPPIGPEAPPVHPGVHPQAAPPAGASQLPQAAPAQQLPQAAPAPQQVGSQLAVPPTPVPTQAQAPKDAGSHVKSMIQKMGNLRHKRDDNVKRKLAYKQPAPPIYKRPTAVTRVKRAAGAAVKRVKARSVDVQETIKVVLARTGLTTFPKSKSFPYMGPGGLEKAKQDAEDWLVSNGV